MLGHWWVDPTELDDQQRATLTLDDDENYLITGPPGSGKTNLLVLRANQLIRSNIPNIKLLVFNRTLEEFIANNPTPYALRKTHISTLQRWEMELISQLGGTPSKATKLEESRAENCRLLKDLCDVQRIKQIHDVIILDEVQDYLDEEIDLICRLATNIFAAGDDRQSIYRSSSPIALLKSKCKVDPLTFHYRNGEKICRLADEIGRAWTDYIPLRPTSQYKEKDNPSTVTSIKCKGIEEQGKQIIDTLRTQLTAFPGEMLGVMCPLRNDVESIYQTFVGTDLERHIVYQNAETGYVPFSSDRRICICTLHSAKGLEFRAAHLAGVDGTSKFRGRQRKMIYTAVTRAKTSLSIYDNGSAPSFVSGALGAITPRTKPKIEDLFKA